MAYQIPETFTDRQLLLLIADKRSDALEKLMYRYENQTFSFVLKIVRDAAIAEEITQDIFIDIWENSQKIQYIESLPAWLYTLSRNKSLNLLKEIASRNLREERFARATPLTADLEDIVHGKDFDRLVYAMIDRLSPKRKEIFRLKMEKGWTNEKIGEYLNISPNTVKNQLAKSYQLLKKEITETILSVLFFVFIK